MSDSAQGPDWWMGTDGKWYPPVAPSSPEGKAAGTVPERDKSSKRFWLIGAGLLAIVIVGSIAVLLIAGGGSSPKHDLTGTFTLEEGTLSATPGKPCTAKSSGYSDISQGTTVTVSDGNGKILATGRLGAGQLGPIVISTMSYCVFPLDVPSVPKADFYKVEVGRRGGLTRTYQEMQDSNWQVALKLG
jgi:hypothetical protein